MFTAEESDSPCELCYLVQVRWSEICKFISLNKSNARKMSFNADPFIRALSLAMMRLEVAEEWEELQSDIYVSYFFFCPMHMVSFYVITNVNAIDIDF